MPTLQTTIELPILLEYACEAGSVSSRDRFGAPLEPDFDPSIELLGITITSSALRVPWTGQQDFATLAAIVGQVTASPHPFEITPLLHQATDLIARLQAARAIPMLHLPTLDRLDLKRLQTEAERHASNLAEEAQLAGAFSRRENPW
jgi:hypothetical protein